MKTFFKIILWSVFLLIKTVLMAQQSYVNGLVLDEITNKPIKGVTVQVNAYSTSITTTGSNGLFTINCREGDSLQLSCVGYMNKTVPVHRVSGTITVKLNPVVAEIEEVEVLSTGYQRIPRERSTGSFDFIDNKIFNRIVSPDIMSRLENLTPGLLFNRGDAEDTDPVLIRGRSTITADASPLIILDDFPYDGDLDNINPNDVENVSVLKDAAAASIWGARAANGVIVITTKKGDSERPNILFNNNITIRGKPDLYNEFWMSSADRVEWERYLFNNGRYSAAQVSNTFNARISPVPEAVELLIADPENIEEELEALKNHDVRDDIGRYFYRTSLSQQHNLHVSGRQDRINYAFSAGYDHNRTQLVGENRRRVTLRSSTAYKVNEKVQLDAVISFIRNQIVKGNNDGISTNFQSQTTGLSPYARFADVSGNPLPYYGQYRKGFIDTVGGGYLMDWTYRPLLEIDRQKTTNSISDLLVNFAGQYRVLPGLNFRLSYQYQHQGKANRMYAHADSYGMRSTINRFTQIDNNTGIVTYPVPLGGALWLDNAQMQSHQGRGQFDFNQAWSGRFHQLKALAGYEVKSRITYGNSTAYYGYDESYESFNNQVDYVTRYPVHNTQGTAQIPLPNNAISKHTDNFLSIYANGSYTYLDRYVLTGSVRKDEANLFGVKSNMKGTPLWSIGGAWNINKESFYKWEAMEYLRLRATYGVNGNISRAAAAYTIGRLSNGGMTHRQPVISIVTPPNEALRWERVRMLNVGVEFSTKENRVSGSLEFYRKHATDLLAGTPTDPTFGFTSVYANTAGMRGTGVDFQLRTVNLNSRVKWQTNLIYSYAATEVSEYLMPVSNMGRIYALSLSGLNPIIGKPLYTAFSYNWAGLNPDNGAPLGYVDGQVSTDYTTIYNNTSLSELVYHGPAQPVHFGALRNELAVGPFEFSFNISYKIGHYFRTPTVSNSGIVNGWTGHGDFAKRWQQSGDEFKTHVPAMIYPANTNRDNFYRNASVHIHRADVVRLEDLNLSYTFMGINHNMPLRHVRVYSYISNIGPIWLANKAGVDPYFNNVPKQPRTVALGLSANF